MSDLNCEFPSGADLTSSHQTKVRNILNILGINIHQQSYNKATKKLQQLYSKETTNLLKSYKKVTAISLQSYNKGQKSQQRKEQITIIVTVII